MQSFFSHVKSFYKVKVQTGNLVFFLHKITAGVLLFLSLLFSTPLLLKEPISCISDNSVSRVIDRYCWITATYTLPEKLNTNFSSEIYAHPGVGQYKPETDKVRIHKFYQWICFVLFFQGMGFYFSHWLWKQWEEGLVKSLATNVKSHKSRVIEYFVNTLGYNDEYSMKFALCEVLAFINVVIQIDLTDRFMGRGLSTYNFQLFQYSRQDPMMRTDALSIVFPIVTKCTFRMFGHSGNIVPYDNLCVLPLNLYSQAVYAPLWFWFIAMAVISGIALVHRLATFLSPEFRFQLIKRKFNLPEKDLEDVWHLNSKLDYGDWFLLFQLGRNISPLTFLEVLRELGALMAPNQTTPVTLKNGNDDGDDDAFIGIEEKPNRAIEFRKEKYQ
jgi:hypothetical protein